MTKVLECLRELENNFSCNAGRDTFSTHARKRWNLQETKCLNGADHSQVETPLYAKLAPDDHTNSWNSECETVLQHAALSGKINIFYANIIVPSTKYKVLGECLDGFILR